MRKKINPLEEGNAEKAFKLHTKIQERETLRRGLLAENIRDLTEMFDSQGYKAILGDRQGLWAGYLGQVEVFYSRSEVEKGRKIYNRLVKELGIDADYWVDIPFSRLLNVINIATTKEEAVHWLEQARHLPASDWKEEIAPHIGKVTPDDCNHEKRTILSICDKCGEKHKQDIGTKSE